MAAVKSVTYEGRSFAYAKFRRTDHPDAYLFWEAGSAEVFVATSEQNVLLLIGGLVAKSRGA